MSQDRKTASNEFILLPREEYKALVGALKKAEEMLASRRELELDLRMARLRLEQKWKAAGHRPTFVDFSPTPPTGTRKDPRRDD